MRIAPEEVFESLLAVIKESDFEKTVEVANNIKYRHSVSIVMQILTEVNRVVEENETGIAKAMGRTDIVALNQITN